MYMYLLAVAYMYMYLLAVTYMYMYLLAVAYMYMYLLAVAYMYMYLLAVAYMYMYLLLLPIYPLPQFEVLPHCEHKCSCWLMAYILIFAGYGPSPCASTQ